MNEAFWNLLWRSNQLLMQARESSAFLQGNFLSGLYVYSVISDSWNGAEARNLVFCFYQWRARFVYEAACFGWVIPTAFCFLACEDAVLTAVGEKHLCYVDHWDNPVLLGPWLSPVRFPSATHTYGCIFLAVLLTVPILCVHVYGKTVESLLVWSESVPLFLFCVCSRLS